MAMLSAAQRAEREAFVSGLEGGSIWEVTAITCVPPALCLASRLVRTRGAASGREFPRGSFLRVTRVPFALEFVGVVFPFLWVLTTEACVAPAVIAAALAVSAACLLGERTGVPGGQASGRAQKAALASNPPSEAPSKPALLSPESSSECIGANGRLEDEKGRRWSIAAARDGGRQVASGASRADGSKRRQASKDAQAAAGCAPNGTSDGFSASSPPSSSPGLRSSVSSSLSLHRGSLGLATALCILAVDFPAFPRRFAKTERRGISIMDLGVGAVVAGGGFGRGLRRDAVESCPPSGSTRRSRRPRLRRWALQTAALLALGVARTAVTRALGYQLHVGEYGLHWNFFLTLACLSIFDETWKAGQEALRGARSGGEGRTGKTGGLHAPASSLVSSLRSFAPLFKIACVLALHAVALPRSGLLAWATKEPRPAGLLSANREGLASLPGFFAVHLASEWIGQYVSRLSAAEGDGARRDQQRPPRVSLRLLGCTLGLWLGAGSAAPLSGPPSRAQADTAYVLAVLAASCTSWAAFDVSQALVARVTVRGRQTRPASPDPSASAPFSPLLVGIARRPLSFFLVANVLTGLVNLTTDPLHAGTVACRATLLVYATALGTLALGGK